MPHRKVPESAVCHALLSVPCLFGADWCLQSDGVPNRPATHPYMTHPCMTLQSDGVPNFTCAQAKRRRAVRLRSRSGRKSCPSSERILDLGLISTMLPRAHLDAIPSPLGALHLLLRSGFVACRLLAIRRDGHFRKFMFSLSNSGQNTKRPHTALLIYMSFCRSISIHCWRIHGVQVRYQARARGEGDPADPGRRPHGQDPAVLPVRQAEARPPRRAPGVQDRVRQLTHHYSSFPSLRHHFGPVLAHLSAPPHPTRAVCCALLGAHAERVLIGAWNPML